MLAWPLLTLRLPGWSPPGPTLQPVSAILLKVKSGGIVLAFIPRGLEASGRFESNRHSGLYPLVRSPPQEAGPTAVNALHAPTRPALHLPPAVCSPRAHLHAC